MTIYRSLINAISMRSKYEQHWVRPAGEPSLGTVTRQRIRRKITEAYGVIVAKQHKEMPRRKRRELARANAARESRIELAKVRAAAVTA